MLRLRTLSSLSSAQLHHDDTVMNDRKWQTLLHCKRSACEFENNRSCQGIAPISMAVVGEVSDDQCKFLYLYVIFISNAYCYSDFMALNKSYREHGVRVLNAAMAPSYVLDFEKGQEIIYHIPSPRSTSQKSKICWTLSGPDNQLP